MTERRSVTPVGSRKKPLAGVPVKQSSLGTSRATGAFAGHHGYFIGVNGLDGAVGFQVDGKARRRGALAYLNEAKAPAKDADIHYGDVFCSSLVAQAGIVKKGIASRILKRVADDMRLDQTRLVSHLGLGRSTYSRKLSNGDPLNLSESERLLGVMRLVGQVEQMVEQSGDPTGFNASEWVGQWLEQSLPALGGKMPADYMDTAAGQELVAQLLRQAQSGAYA